MEYRESGGHAENIGLCAPTAPDSICKGALAITLHVRVSP